jgi:hypothetical protein
MHITTVYESLPHVVLPPAELFDQPVQVTWTTLPISNAKSITTTAPVKEESVREIFARIGKWAGEPLVREPQGELQERDALL